MTDDYMYISVIDANDQLSEALLDEDLFYLGLSWNETGRYWTMSLRSSGDDVICSGLKLLPLKATLLARRKSGMPKGEFLIYAPTIIVLERDSFAKGLAALFYVPQDLLISSGLIQYEIVV